MHSDTIIRAIERSPLNRGLSGEMWLRHPGNVAIVHSEDIALFDNEGAGTYQVHFLFASRGSQAVVAARRSFAEMFNAHKAELIFGLVPDSRREVKLLARWAGGKYAGKRETSHGVCELFVLSKQMWE